MLSINGTVIVIGDIMLDVYIHGEAFRLSPEAPVPIVSVSNRINTLGGAGNVANNLVGLGCKVHLLGMRGDDVAGHTIVDLLTSKGVEHSLYVNQLLPTTTKTRVMANHQQLIRFDDERLNGSKNCQSYLRNAIDEIITLADAIILSDYGKGVLSPDLLQYVIHHANGFHIPILVDPKRSNWNCYSEATIITPNVSELENAIGGISCDDDEIALGCIEQLRESFGIKTVVLTRGAKGMLVVNDDTTEFIPTVAKSVFDVSGAGDTVIATMAACISSGYSITESAKIANAAAGIVVGKLGTSPIEFSELQDNLLLRDEHGQTELNPV